MTIFTKSHAIIGGLVLASLLSAPASATLANYEFDISVGTGSKAGNDYSGTFGFDTDLLTGVGVESLTTSYFTFNYPPLGGTMTPYALVSFQDGVFQKIQAMQFGSWAINMAFSPSQVTSLCGGQPGCSPTSYFAYLVVGPAVIDGAGPITYDLLPPSNVPELDAASGTGALGLLLGSLGLAAERRRRFA